MSGVLRIEEGAPLVFDCGLENAVKLESFSSWGFYTFESDVSHDWYYISIERPETWAMIGIWESANVIVIGNMCLFWSWQCMLLRSGNWCYCELAKYCVDEWQCISLKNWQHILFRIHIFNQQGFDRWLGHLNPEKVQTEYPIVSTLHIFNHQALTDMGNFSSAKLTWQLFS